MDGFGVYLITVLNQFGGGAGGQENELVRFGLGALLWGVLLAVAWSRRRQGGFARERWLLWGFGLAFTRELFMFTVKSLIVSGAIQQATLEVFFPPAEHTLRLLAITVITAAFLRFVLEDPRPAWRQIYIGFALAITAYAVMCWPWAQAVLADPAMRFGKFWGDWVEHGVGLVIIGLPMLILLKRSGWLPAVVAVAFGLFFLDDLLMLFNLGTGEAYKHVFGPVRHNAHNVGIALLGYVYFREMSDQRLAAEKSLDQERTLLRTLIDNLPDAIFVKNEQGRFLVNNHAHAQALGAANAAEVIGKTDFDFLPGDLAGDNRREEQQIRNSGKPLFDREQTLQNGDGKIEWRLTTKVPLLDLQGRCNGVVGISRDISELKKAEQALQASYADLENQIQIRTKELQTSLKKEERAVADLEAFAYSVAHDLKSPLRAMEGFSVALAEDYGERMDQTARGYLDYIAKGATRMSVLIDDLLRYAQLGNAELSFGPVDPADLVEQIKITLRHDIDASGAIIRTDGPLPAVQAHRLTLELMLQNLIGNAIKYSRPGVRPEIRVSVAAEHGYHVISVQDNGIGIEPAQQTRIFEIFQRLHTDDRYTGTGIGLAIVKKGVELHHGSISVNSRPEVGSTFTLRLPERQR